MSVDGQRPRTWLERNQLVIVAGIALFSAEVLIALVLPKFYWWPIIEQHVPLHFCVAGLLGILLILTGWLVRELRWYIRIGLFVLVVLPLPMAFCAAPVFSPTDYLGSAALHEHVYHLSTMEVSGRFYYLDECDSVGFFCHQVASYMGGSEPSGVNLIADPVSNAIYIIMCDADRKCVMSHEYDAATGRMSP